MTISFASHQFPPDIIRHAVWLYMRFTLSHRDVEDLLAERSLDGIVTLPWGKREASAAQESGCCDGGPPWALGRRGSQ
jgi:hypothetical protein